MSAPETSEKMTAFKGKVIAITGAASGIGLATAKALASLGARVSVCDVDEANLAALATELTSLHGECNVHSQVVDVADRAAVESWISSAVEKLGPLDGAANCAGVLGRQGNRASILELEDDEWDFVMGVNARGVLNAMRAQIPRLKDGGKGGSIVNVGSVSGLYGLEFHGAYTASKHAVVGLSKAAAREFGRRGVRVNVVCPGAIDTPILRKSLETAATGAVLPPPLVDRFGQPEEVSSIITFLLSDAASYITGQAMLVDGGMLP